MKIKFKFLSLIIIAAMILYMYMGIESADTNNSKESLKILKDAILRSAVQCYAIEGFYPPNTKYLENNYGLLVDHDKYFISYSVFASNIAPQVEVFAKNIR